MANAKDFNGLSTAGNTGTSQGSESLVSEFNESISGQVADTGTKGSMRIIKQDDGAIFAEITASTGEKATLELL